MNIEKAWHGPACYQIEVKGRLGSQWSDWFEGMTISYKEGVTTITGEVAAQAALHGLLIRVRYRRRDRPLHRNWADRCTESPGHRCMILTRKRVLRAKQKKKINKRR